MNSERSTANPSDALGSRTPNVDGPESRTRTPNLELQKMYLPPIWTTRGARAVVVRPNVPSVREPLGLLRFTQLPVLNASSRTCSFALRGPRVPGTSKFLNSDRSKLLY